MRLRNCILGHKSVQRREIQQRLHPRCANALQTNRDLSIHEFLFVSSIRRKERIHKRRGAAPPKNKFVTLKNMQSFKTRLKNRGYPNEFLEKHLFEVNFKDRKRSLENKDKSTKKKILPFITQYHPALPNVKNILVGKWHLIQNQPYAYLKEVFSGATHTIISQRKVVKRHLGNS